ncbi:putative LRR receptor-like serine/threonine-protein kinase, partial [Leptotrombidium deliense]
MAFSKHMPINFEGIVFNIAPENFENISLLGEGSYGKVWKARDKQSQRIGGDYFALKITKPSAKWKLRTFVAEVQILRKLNHTNVVKLFEAGIDAQNKTKRGPCTSDGIAVDCGDG